VRVASGRVVAAVNVSTATARVSRERLLDEFVPALVKTAASVSARLGFPARSPTAADRAGS
jgi:IclR family pca regulon transcriptional regulator